MNTDKLVTGEEILLVKKTNLVRAYRSESEGFKGKNYRVYALGDKAFAVHEDDAFHTAFENGSIKTIAITVSDEGYSLSNFVTWKQAIAQKQNQMVFDSITVENFSAGKVVSLDAIPNI